MFFRDTTQWSQLILLGVLVVVYVYNIKVLPLYTGEEVSFFLINVVSFLNLGLAGFVVAARNSRSNVVERASPFRSSARFRLRFSGVRLLRSS